MEHAWNSYMFFSLESVFQFRYRVTHNDSQESVIHPFIFTSLDKNAENTRPCT